MSEKIKENLNPNELLAHDGNVVLLKVEEDKLVLPSGEISLSDLNTWLQPGTPLSVDAGTPGLEDEYEKLGWELQLGDFTIIGCRGIKHPIEGVYAVLIKDSSGQLRAEMRAGKLMHLARSKEQNDAHQAQEPIPGEIVEGINKTRKATGGIIPGTGGIFSG